MFIKQRSVFDYQAILADAPNGIEARITRLTPNLTYDATVIVPESYGLPASVEDKVVVTSMDRKVVHRSFDALHDARTWVNDLVTTA
ncbi:hypothetical protein BW13_05530 [Bifidobacterium sp. UTCIF-37]|uniref:Uncharacterized protein n=1 Tax=Bifidobacterium callitrichos TaxID=762209 RepID=A0A5M9ZDP7_9BIFI|nr:MULTISPECIES: hypothetical protein [Bifidobacterium]KAA8817257.1 hypothetical protein EMB92_01315 [Bifidobacterium callitrichos]TPF86265.1 hypothetical protein BW13_05530 [Bifidobacterium sp. UTCIF-37]TPF88725.1 hypothetical protein BW11_06330 [Bifidobacterium sp. UTCIF-38]